MNAEVQILTAFAIDLYLGDPVTKFHPVSLIARLALLAENKTRSVFCNSQIAGIVAVGIVLIAVVSFTTLLINIASSISEFSGAVVSLFIIYLSFALKSLADHAMAVYEALAVGDVALAKQKVGMIVGRDTVNMDEKDIVTACVESVAESTVDGVTAPIFYAIIAGPVGAMAYKAVNTMDSMFGYKNEKYIHFGWAAARLDDIANYVPARITAFMFVVAAFLLGKCAKRTFWTIVLDGAKSESPNSGLVEAGMAGALGIALGGGRSYDGVKTVAPVKGVSFNAITCKTLPEAIKVSTVGSVLFLAVILAVFAGF